MKQSFHPGAWKRCRESHFEGPSPTCLPLYPFNWAVIVQLVQGKRKTTPFAQCSDTYVTRNRKKQIKHWHAISSICREESSRCSQNSLYLWVPACPVGPSGKPHFQPRVHLDSVAVDLAESDKLQSPSFLPINCDIPHRAHAQLSAPLCLNLSPPQGHISSDMFPNLKQDRGHLWEAKMGPGECLLRLGEAEVPLPWGPSTLESLFPLCLLIPPPSVSNRFTITFVWNFKIAQDFLNLSCLFVSHLSQDPQETGSRSMYKILSICRTCVHPPVFFKYF